MISVPVWLKKNMNQREKYYLNVLTSISASIDTLKMSTEVHPVDYRGWTRGMEFQSMCWRYRVC